MPSGVKSIDVTVNSLMSNAWTGLAVAASKIVTCDTLGKRCPAAHDSSSLTVAIRVRSFGNGDQL